MGVSPATFNSAGSVSQHYIPGVYSRRNNVAGGSGVSTGNLVILGTSTGGEPLRLLKFSDTADAKETLVGGDLLEGVAHAFNGSAQYVPQSVWAMRVNNGTKSRRAMKSGNSEILILTSKDWGVHTNQIKMWYESAEGGGKSVRVSYKGEEQSVGKVARDSFSLAYAGEGAGATCTIGAAGLTLSARDSDGEEIAGEGFSVDFTTCETVADLVSRINETGKYLATLIDNTDGARTAELDHAAGVSVGTSAAVFGSNLQALIEALGGIEYIGGVEIADGASRVLPDDDTGFVYFTGGTNGGNTVGDYINALAALETEDVQIIATTSTDSDIHSLISDHCTSMSSVHNKRERTFFVGMPSSTTIEAGLAEAKSLNTELGSVIITGANASSPLTGKAEDISPALLACKVAGMESAMNMSVPLTNKALKVNSFSVKYRRGELDAMIAGGVMPFGENEEGALVCIRGITCYQSDSLIMNERSMIRSVLYMDRDLRRAFGARTGTNAAPSESGVIQVLLNKARGWLTDELITQDDSGNNVFDVSVRFDADRTYLSFSRYVRAPNNFTFITATNRVYSSTVEI